MPLPLFFFFFFFFFFALALLFVVVVVVVVVVVCDEDFCDVPGPFGCGAVCELDVDVEVEPRPDEVEDDDEDEDDEDVGDDEEEDDDDEDDDDEEGDEVVVVVSGEVIVVVVVLGVHDSEIAVAPGGSPGIADSGVPAGTSTVIVVVWPVTSWTVTTQESADATGSRAIAWTASTVLTVPSRIVSFLCLSTIALLLPPDGARTSTRRGRATAPDGRY